MADKNTVRGNGWKKGQSGNPSGRPKDEGQRLLKEAIARYEKEKDVSFFDHCIEQAFVSHTILKAVLKKLVPDLKYVETDLSGSVEFVTKILAAAQDGKWGKVEDRIKDQSVVSN